MNPQKEDGIFREQFRSSSSENGFETSPEDRKCLSQISRLKPRNGDDDLKFRFLTSHGYM